MFFPLLVLFGAISLACSGQAEGTSELATTKALRCVVVSLNATQGKGQDKSSCSDDGIFVTRLLTSCEDVYRDFAFIKWFLEKRPHDDWVIPLATTTSTSTSTQTTTTDNSSSTENSTTAIPATTGKPQLYGARRIVEKYCDFSGPKGQEAYNFYVTFNDVWTDIQEDLDKTVDRYWFPAHDEVEFCSLYDTKFVVRAREIAHTKINLLGLTAPSYGDLANDVMDYLDRSVRLAYFVNHFVHFGDKPIPDACRVSWFPDSIMNS